MTAAMDQAQRAIEWLRLWQAATASYLQELAGISAAVMSRAAVDAGAPAPAATAVRSGPARKRRRKSASAAAKGASAPKASAKEAATRKRRRGGAKPARRRRRAG